MIAIEITNSPRRRYTFHFEDSNEAKNIATLLGKGEEWKKYDRVVTSKNALAQLFKMKTVDYSPISTNNPIILSNKDRLAIRFFLNLIHKRLNLKKIENSTVIIERSAYIGAEVSVFKKRFDTYIGGIFKKLKTTNVINTKEMEDIYAEVMDIRERLFKAFNNVIREKPESIFQQLLTSLNQYKNIVEEYINTMKKDNLVVFAIYKDGDLETIQKNIDTVKTLFEKLMNSKVAQKETRFDLNKPMSSRITFFFDSDGSDFTKFFTKSEKMNMKRVKKNKKWKYSYHLNEFTLHSNNSELTAHVLPYIFSLGSRKEFYQKLDFCVLNGNLETVISTKLKLKQVGERYNPKITYIQNENEKINPIKLYELIERMNDLKDQIEYLDDSGPVKIKHFTNRELNLIDKNLSSDNSEICLYLSHPKKEVEEEIFEWVKEEDLDKLCNSNESFTYLDCRIIRDNPKENEINVRFSRFFLDEE